MTPDTAINQPPKVLLWFKIYCGFLCLLYLALVAFSLFFFFADPSDTELSEIEARITGVLMLVIGVALFVVCLLPLILTPRPWLWTFDLVVICLGMTSACFLPACIPLLIFWLKPETKRYFGKS
jgi:hypothetical protein